MRFCAGQLAGMSEPLTHQMLSATPWHGFGMLGNGVVDEFASNRFEVAELRVFPGSVVSLTPVCFG